MKMKSMEKTRSGPAATKYPIVMSHGPLARAITLKVPFWWGITKALEDAGADVHISDQPAFGRHARNAEYLKDFVLEVLEKTGKEKVNIIGHATGATEARYMISNLGMADKVASLTSIAGPHRGSSYVDTVFKVLPKRAIKLVAGAMNLYGRLIGDEEPDALGIFSELTTDYMTNTFNPNTPDMPGVYYQSWIGRIRYVDPEKAIFWGLPWLLMLYCEGPNDGWVSTRSAKWGKFLGEQRGKWWSSGVSHDNEINQFFGLIPGYDPRPYYIKVVSELKQMGF